MGRLFERLSALKCVRQKVFLVCRQHSSKCPDCAQPALGRYPCLTREVVRDWTLNPLRKPRSGWILPNRGLETKAHSSQIISAADGQAHFEHLQRWSEIAGCRLQKA